MGRFLDLGEAWLNSRGQNAVRDLISGMLWLGVGAAALGGVMWLVSDALRHIAYGWVVELVIMATLIASRSLYSHVRDVQTALEGTGVEAAREKVALIVGRNTDELEEPAIARAAVESLAENASDGVIAPLFWGLLAGLPGIAIYKLINTADSMWGHRNDRYEWFGKCAARLDDVLNLIPARLTGLLFCIAAASRGRVASAFRVMMRDASKHLSPNAGWPEAAMAGALGRRLGGPRSYQGRITDGVWLGDGSETLDAADVRHGLRPLIDLSTGINPHAFEPKLDPIWSTRLPGLADEEACRSAFAAYASVNERFVHIMPGSQSIISGLPHLFKPCEVAVLSPTYGEHEFAWQAAGHSVSRHLAADVLAADAHIILVTHPNNPDGHVFDRDDLLACKKRQQARSGWLIVDEAFVDCMPEISVATEVEHGGLLVLRSFGKFFGLAGLRLGFLIGPDSIATSLTQRLGPWSVGTPVLRIAAEAYGDVKWGADTRNDLDHEMGRLRKVVVPIFGNEVGHTTLFLLIESVDAEAVAAHLAAYGIFVRTFPDMPNYLRLGLPGASWAWDRLETALTEWEHKNER
eukprot:s1_g965.t1